MTSALIVEESLSVQLLIRPLLQFRPNIGVLGGTGTPATSQKRWRAFQDLYADVRVLSIAAMMPRLV
jgi:hypothetical protein